MHENLIVSRKAPHASVCFPRITRIIIFPGLKDRPNSVIVEKFIPITYPCLRK